MAAKARAILKPAHKKAPEPAARAAEREPQERKSTPPKLSIAGGGDVIRRSCACGGGCSRCGAKQNRERLQPRIEIGPEGDEFEIEAEQMAERVVAAAAGAPPPAAPAPPAAPGGSGSSTGSGDSGGAASPPPANAGNGPNHSVRLRTTGARAFRRCACGGSCSSCKDDDRLRARRSPARNGTKGAGETGALLPRELGPGRALPANTRRFMESQFGRGFEGVRIHDDARAAEAAQSINAQAYTVGADIVFGPGQFQPSSMRGIHLLAHELTHVVQQGASSRAADVTATGTVSQRAQPMMAQRQAVTPNEPGDCPPVPTGLGHTPAVPACPRASHAGTTLVGSWHFCLDSNTLVAGESLANIPRLIASHHIQTRYQVHGHASTDGAAAYNEVLACHRANTVGDALAAALRTKLGATPMGFSPSMLQDHLEVATRGETSEFGNDLESNRVVTLFAEIPGSTIPDEPSCEEAPRRIGDVPFEVPCDRPTRNLEGRGSERHVGHFRFCLDSDALLEPVTNIGTFAARQASTAMYTIHGFASTEGAADYNQRLSCHRALRVARELMNAGVRSQQIREVSGIGETAEFSFGQEGFEESNRVAVVLAEDADISRINDGRRPADNNTQKRAIVEEAKDRLMRGQYRSGADFYINKWTCGHTPTVAAAVERLQVSWNEESKTERLRDPANGVEEDPSLGRGGVKISNAAMRCDNPVECVMGRLVDMAFHHSVLGEALMPGTLTEPRPKRQEGEKFVPPTLRHLAGLHLASLAGLFKCEGDNVRAEMTAAFGPVGIDEPLDTDPLASTDLPACAVGPQPTRSAGPMPGDRERDTMNFAVLDQSRPLLDGRLKRVGDPDDDTFVREARAAPVTFTTASDVMRASATVGLIGQREHFDDYEIGFMQTVVDDLFLAEYVDGSRVLQKLPLPIRAAHTRDAVPAPSPWMGIGRASARPNSQGIANVRASWQLESDFGITMDLFRPRSGQAVLLDTWQRHTRVALWLAARRRAMPLDRFSVFPISGSVFEVTQNLDRGIVRTQGDMMGDERKPVDPTVTGQAEREQINFTAGFRTQEVSSDPMDMQQAKFDRPVASEIDIFRQFQRIIEPESAANTNGMTRAQYIATATRILDGMRDLGPRPDGTIGPVADSRLSFRTAALDVTIRVNPRTGRLPPYSNPESAENPGANNPITIEAPGLGSRARYHLARALALRLQKRDFLGQGVSAILMAPPSNGILRFRMGPTATEVNLLTIPGVVTDMRALWACSMFTRTEPGFLCPLEFAMTYTRDRTGAINRRAFQSRPDPGCDEKIQTDIKCDNPDKMAIGMFHTHPQDRGDALGPSSGDLASEQNNPGGCGAQLFIVSEDFVTEYRADGSLSFKRDRRSVIGDQGTSCPLDITPDFKEEIV